MIEDFQWKSKINDLLESENQKEGRNELLKYLEHIKQEDSSYDEITNHLIRKSGLFPYMDINTSSWSDRFVYEAFRVDVGENKGKVLHREQSFLLKELLDGKSLVVSAPTSFGKSFVIDSFVSIKKPESVVIIVPTIALADETRRRLHRKFSDQYRIITTSGVDLARKNIFIFPQERVSSYINQLKGIDILIVDEFYKASKDYDKERASSLMNAMLKLNNLASQRYYLAPNISEFTESVFTKGMKHHVLDFNTVFLNIHENYKEFKKDQSKKIKCLLNLIKKSKSKTLVYIGNHSEFKKLKPYIVNELPKSASPWLRKLSRWLKENYSKNWILVDLIERGVGIHHGRLHRSLGQIQIRLFEDSTGINTIFSTSSIIEGVNTSAKNVILWKNKISRYKLNSFTYKNIIGRGGRMLKHFVGDIYLLEEPPPDKEAQLELSFSDNMLGDLDEKVYSNELSDEEIARIIAYKEEMGQLFGGRTDYEKMVNENVFQVGDTNLRRVIAEEIYNKKHVWNSLKNLHSSEPHRWEKVLYRVIKLDKSGWDALYSEIVKITKLMAGNWHYTIPQLLEKGRVDLEDFFRIERTVTFKLSSLLSDVNIICEKIIGNPALNISPFVTKLSHAFLPPSVYFLEEYGLPRMIAKKIQTSRLVDFENSNLHESINKLKILGFDRLKEDVTTLSDVDHYILKHFLDGV